MKVKGNQIERLPKLESAKEKEGKKFINVSSNCLDIHLFIGAMSAMSQTNATKISKFVEQKNWIESSER